MNPEIIDITILGNKFRMEFHPNIFMQGVMYHDLTKRSEPYEREVTEKICKLLSLGDTFVDVGAHIGWFTLLAASIVGHVGRVLAIEPDKANFGFLERQINLNRINGSVRIKRCALTDEMKEVVLFHNSDNDGGHAIWPVWKHDFNKKSLKSLKVNKVQGMTLDEICEQNQITYIDLLKIDTEGAEVKVLQGAEKLLSNHRIKHVIAEVNEFGLDQLGNSPKELIGLMTNHGYVPSQIDDHGLECVFNVLFSLKD